MIAAILLLFVSQFFLYLNDGGGGYIPQRHGPGALHPGGDHQLRLGRHRLGRHLHAYVILVVLAFAFLRDDIQSSALFSRFGWWASLVLVFAATVPEPRCATPSAARWAASQF